MQAEKVTKCLPDAKILNEYHILKCVEFQTEVHMVCNWEFGIIETLSKLPYTF